MKIFRVLAAISLLAALMAPLGSANADILSLNFSGTINVVTNPNAIAALGDHAEGTFYINTESPRNSTTTGPNVANYSNAITSASVSVTHGAVTSTVTGPTLSSYFEIDNDASSAVTDFLNIGVFGLVGPSTDRFSSELFLNLGDSTATVFSNVDFPRSLDLDSFDFRRFQINFDRFQVFGNVESVTLASVPEPATLALIGIAFAGLGFSRRKSCELTAS